MVLKANKCVYIATTAYGATDGKLISAIFGFLPPAQDMDMRRIVGDESKYLFSKNKLFKDLYFTAMEATMRLHIINSGLEFAMTSQGDIIIYRKNNFHYTLEEVLDSYERYIKEDNSKGDILHEGEYILISKKITVETQQIGYSVLSHIGINTSKVNYIGTTTNFLTYSVIEDLELPFVISVWQDFTIKDTSFHPYTKAAKNLILIENYERIIKYTDEIHEFFEKKEKEKEKMLNNKFIVNEDYFKVDANPFANNPYFDIFKPNALESVPDKLPDITLEDLRIESSVRTEPLIRGTFRVSPGIIRETRKFQFTQYADSLNIHAMPRGLGRSSAISMLNSLYGLNPTGGLLNWNDWDNSFKLYFGVERATGKQKTVCLWKDGEKTVIRGDKSVLRMPVQYAVAWCYVKRSFKTTSQFKKYVDKYSHIMDGITYFEGDARCKMAQASVNNRTKKYDIYDAAALAITAKNYGSVKTIMNYCDGWGE
jgi:hypothetical protein